MYRLLRPVLFKLEPESAHALTLLALRASGSFAPLRWVLSQAYRGPEKPLQVMGLRFRNPVGLAAGYDKDAAAVRGLACLGFGHIEVGTVTLRPQPGNPQPRVFRLVEDRAVINRMGFPGKGAEHVARALRAQPRDTVVGVNLGKNRDTTLEEAASDYVELMRIFAPLADYLTINISSPNTAGLRHLQGRALLEQLLKTVADERGKLPARPPMLVKLAPDLTGEELEHAVGAILESGMDGIIATNTTVSRDGLRSPRQAETGGLSGAPLRERSEAMLQEVVRQVSGQIAVVSAGGIMHPADARRRLDLGADLVQVYTGLVYAGPGLVKDILAHL